MDLSRLGSVLRTRWGAVSDAGPARATNEDRWLAAPPLFAVADGMGGHAHGEVASQTALDTLRDTLDSSDADVVGVDRAICHAAQAVSALPHEQPAAAPGSTLTGIVGTRQDGQPCWIVFNVGDSRTYLIAGGDIIQLTIDDIADLPGRTHVVTQALGAGMVGLPSPGYCLVESMRGDRFVLCSDGVHGVLDAAAIGRIVEDAEDPQAASAALVDASLSAGARDNVTAMVVECIEATPESRAPVSARERPIKTLRRASATTAPRAPSQEGS